MKLKQLFEAIPVEAARRAMHKELRDYFNLGNQAMRVTLSQAIHMELSSEDFYKLLKVNHDDLARKEGLKTPEEIDL